MKYATVTAVPHPPNDIITDFVQLSTSSYHLRLTKDHYILGGPCENVLSLIRADELKMGNCVLTVKGKSIIQELSIIQGRGIATVITIEEYLVVNGIIASPFASNHAAGRFFYKLLELIDGILPSKLFLNKSVNTYSAFLNFFMEFSI